MTFEEIRKIVAGVELRGVFVWMKAELHVMPTFGYENKGIEFSIRYQVPNSFTGETVPISIDRQYFLEEMTRESHVIELAGLLLKEALAHEVDEGFWYKNKFVTHPHPEQLEANRG